MMKILVAAAGAAAVLAVAPLSASAEPPRTESFKLAQALDVEINRDRDRFDRDRFDRDRSDRRRDRDVTIGVGPGGVAVGPRRHCRTVTTTIERGDGRSVTRRERRCD